MGSKEIVGSLIDKINMTVDGGQLIQAAIAFEKADMLKLYIEHGANVEMPPETVSKLYIDHERKPEYRKAPFII
jgi:ankyrin repeat protein